MNPAGAERKDVHEEFERLLNVLKHCCRDSPVFYLANPGNWGDALIRQGTLKFFRDHGIEFVELPLKSHRERIKYWFQRGTLIYGGGGGWCSLWDHSFEILNARKQRFRNIVILPSTYEKTYRLENATFFCRDRHESQQAMPEATFCHDMAFYLGPQPSSPGEGDGHFFRTDPERSGACVVPADNHDISMDGTHWSDPAPFFQQISKHAVIHTDRLHVAIASCLLGKELHFYPGSYFKNRATFLSSMDGVFEKVHFHDIDVKCQERV